jgi:DNA adenine methylase
MRHPKPNSSKQVSELEQPEIDLTGVVPEGKQPGGDAESEKGVRRSLYRMPGSKWKLMPKLVRLFPNHDHFVSVFGGTGAEILRKPRSRLETFNDRCNYIYNLFRVIQDDNLCKRLQETIQIPQCRGLYEDALNVLTKQITDPVATAAAFLIVAHQGRITRHPCLKKPNHWRAHTLPTHLKPWLSLPETLDCVRQRLLKVQIENYNWFRMIDKYDSPTTLFLFDPPYYPDTLSSSNDFYLMTMTEGEHRAMLRAVRGIQGHVVLCGYKHKVYEKALGDWCSFPFGAVTTVDNQGTRHNRIEIVWTNYDPKPAKLWLPSGD